MKAKETMISMHTNANGLLLGKPYSATDTVKMRRSLLETSCTPSRTPGCLTAKLMSTETPS